MAWPLEMYFSLAAMLFPQLKGRQQLAAALQHEPFSRRGQKGKLFSTTTVVFLHVIMQYGLTEGFRVLRTYSCILAHT